MASEKIDALQLDIDAKLNTENLDKLISKLGELGKALDNLKGKSVSVNIKETGDAAKTSSKSVDNLASSFVSLAAKITAAIVVLRKFASVVSDGIVESMSYTENLNLFTVSLGEYSENAAKYGDTVREALGIDPSGWIRTQGVFNTLIEGFGVGAEQAAYMSQNLTQLTYDIASFYNLSITDAEKKIQSAVAGELEPVRRLGYDLSQNALTAIAQNPEYYGKTTYYVNQETGALEANTEALEDNTVRTVANFNELTQGEKVQLRYIALMTQVQEAQGDMARTLNDPANQMRIFKEQLTMTSRALGNAFIPALNQVMPYVTAFFQVIEEGLQRIASLLGYELPDMSDRMSVSDVAGGYEDIADDTGRAAKNAKKIKDYMIGIDELNVLRPDDGTSGGSGSSNDTYALGSIFSTPGYDFLGSAIENRIKDAKAQLDLFRSDLEEHPLQVIGTVLWEGLGGLGEGIWTHILGMTPEELAEEAARNGNSVGEQFVIAYSNAIQNSAFGEFSEGVVQYVLMGGKSSEEFYSDAEKSGQSVGSAFLIGMVVNSTIPSSLGGMISFWEIITGKDTNLASRAAAAGRTVGEQFTAEVGKQLLELVASNPVFEWIYNTSTGRDAQRDLEDLEKKLYSNNKKRYQKVQDPSLGNTSADEARKRGEAAAKAYNEGVTQNTGMNIWDTIWNGSDAQKRGRYMIEDFAKGMNSGMSSVRLGASNLYKTALNGVNNNGTASTNFANLGSNMTRAFTSALASQGSLNNAYNAGYKVSQFGYEGANANTVAYSNIANSLANLFSSALGSSANRSKAYSAGSYLSNEGSWGTTEYNDDYYYTGDMAGQGFVLGIRKHEYNAKVEGQRIAQAALYNLASALGIASPSKEAYKMGAFFDEGFANAISDYTYTATDAADEMARLSLQAIRTSNAMFNSGVSIPSGTNAGYGIGMANEGAMASLASNIYQAVVSGMATYGGANEGRDIKVVIDGKEVFTAVQTESRKRGVAISNGAFSR